MQVNNIEDYYNVLSEKAEVVKGLYEAFYGMKEFYIKDPNGYMVGFAEKA
jgi:uncharacterized glyoxalase superfamily protein PhnB